MNLKKLLCSAAVTGIAVLLALFVFAEEEINPADAKSYSSVEMSENYEDDKPTDSIPDDFDEPEQSAIQGDVDGDRAITTSDASAILRFIVGYSDANIEIQYGDVDGDEEITTSDASAVLRYIVGYKDNPDIGQPVEY